MPDGAISCDQHAAKDYDVVLRFMSCCRFDAAGGGLEDYAAYQRHGNIRAIASFGEKKLALEADRPLGTVLRSGDIVEGLDGEVDGQLAEMDDFAEAPADGHGPHIA